MTCLEVFCIVSETLLTFNQGKNIVCEYIINIILRENFIPTEDELQYNFWKKGEIL